MRFIPSARALALAPTYFGYRAPSTDADGHVTGFATAPSPMQAGCLYTIVGNPTWDPARTTLQTHGKWFGEYLVDGLAGDAVPAGRTHLDEPCAIALQREPTGDASLYVVDSGNQRVRRVSRATGAIMTFAGAPAGPQQPDGLGGYAYPRALDAGGDGGPATQARLADPSGIAFDVAGRAYLADAASGRLRMVDLHGAISTVAGRLHAPGIPASDRVVDGEALAGVDLYGLAKLAVDVQGNLLFDDLQHGRLRQAWRQWE